MKINKETNSQLDSIITQCKSMIYQSGYRNSIVLQLSDIAFHDAVYRTFNEGLRLDRDNKNRPLIIIDLFHKYYFESQAISIRRIFDKGKDVYSLRRIFDVIYNNSCKITRKQYLESNINTIEILSSLVMKEKQRENLNLTFDQISKVNKNNRSENDKLYFPYLESMKKYLDRRSILHEYTNSYITHSFNQKRMNLTQKEHEKMSLKKMQYSYIDISWLAYTLSKYLGELILFEVPIPQYDVFEGWVGSIYEKNIKRSLITYWDKRINYFKKLERKYWFSNTMYITPYKSIIN